MNSKSPMDKMKTSNFDFMPKFTSPQEEQTYKKQRLIGAFRLFGKFGFDEGAAGKLHIIGDDDAANTHAVVGNPLAGWFSFQPLYNAIIEDQPDCLE